MGVCLVYKKNERNVEAGILQLSAYSRGQNYEYYSSIKYSTPRRTQHYLPARHLPRIL